MIKLLRLSELDRPKWEELLSVSPAATIFHTAEWARLWEESYTFFESCFLVDAAPDGSYRAGLPYVKAKKFLTGYHSMPMGSYGGAVAPAGNETTELYRRWLQRSAGPERDRLVVISPYEIPVLEALAFKKKELSTQMVERPEGGWSGKIWPARTRTKMRRAAASALVLRLIQRREEARPCFRLARDKRGPSFYGERFFENLFELLAPAGRLRWLAAFRGEVLAGFQIYLGFRNELFYWDGAFDERFARHQVGYFLFRHIFLEAETEGFQRINLGATPAEAAGVRFFKKQLGGRERPVFEYTYASALKRKLRSALDGIRGRK